MKPRYHLTNPAGEPLIGHPGYHSFETAHDVAWADVTLGDHSEVQVREIETNEVLSHLINPKGKKQ